MTTTAQWLHLRFGMPLVEADANETAGEQSDLCADADLIALQKAYAAAPLTVQFVGR
jgi:hypothetical protein